MRAPDVVLVTSQPTSRVNVSQPPSRLNAGRPSAGLPSPGRKSTETVSPGKNVPSVERSWRPNDGQKRLDGDVCRKPNDPGSLSPRNRTPGQPTLRTKTSSAVNPGGNSPGPGTGSSTPTESRISAPNRSAAPGQNPDRAAQAPPATVPRCEQLRRPWLVSCLNHNDLLAYKCTPPRLRRPDSRVETGKKSTPTLHPGSTHSRARGCDGVWPRKPMSGKLVSARTTQRSGVPELSGPLQWEPYTASTLSKVVYSDAEAGRMAADLSEQLARGSPKNNGYASSHHPWPRRLPAIPARQEFTDGPERSGRRVKRVADTQAACGS